MSAAVLDAGLLAAACPAGEVFAGDSARDFSVCGLAPTFAAAPRNREEAAALIRVAAEAGAGVVCWGGGTRIDAGFPPERLDLVLVTRYLDRVVDYQPDDMTVTVEPGVTLEALQSRLASRRQFLPLNPPLPSRATVGGVVASRSAGSWRCGFGTPRDWVIGCRVIGADGLEVRGGGQVVKNVAGYDLPKLYTGSFGSLGLISELTFKVLPLPADLAYSRVELPDDARLEPLLAAISGSQLDPAALELRQEAAGWSLLFQFMHVEEALRWQQVELERLAEKLGLSASRLSIEAGNEALDELRDRPGLAPFCAMVTCVGSEVAETAAGLRKEFLPEGFEVQAHAAAGPVYLLGKSAPDESRLTALRERAERRGGRVLFTRLPPECAGRVDPWGGIGHVQRVQSAIKLTLDPHRIFAPGRLPGRI